VTPRSWWINEDLEFGAVVCVRIIETTWCFVDKRLGGEEGIVLDLNVRRMKQRSVRQTRIGFTNES
jgi:hypothetical protein